MTHLDERFADWVDGRLRPAEREALEAELARDPELQRRADEYRRTVQLLRSALAPPEMGRSVADAVMAELGADRAPTPRLVRNWRPFYASLAVAAALLLVSALVWLIPPASPPVHNEPMAALDEPLISRHVAPPGEEPLEREEPDAAMPPSAPATKAKVAETDERKRLAPGEVKLGEAAERPAADSDVFFLGGARRESLSTGQPGERKVPPTDPVTERERVPGQTEAGIRPVEGPGAKPDAKPEAVAGAAAGGLSPGTAGGGGAAAEPEALRLDDIGELVAVVELAAPVRARLGAELSKRATALSAAELLAVLAPKPAGVDSGSVAVDLRSIAVVDVDWAGLAAVRNKDAAGGGGGGRLEQLQPGDRVLRLTGTGAQVREFTAQLQTRLPAEFGSLSYRRLPGQEVRRLQAVTSASEDNPAAPAPRVSAGRGSRVGSRPPASPGPASPGPASPAAEKSPPPSRSGAAPSQPDDKAAAPARGVTPDDTRAVTPVEEPLSLFVVLRTKQ